MKNYKLSNILLLNIIFFVFLFAGCMQSGILNESSTAKKKVNLQINALSENSGISKSVLPGDPTTLIDKYKLLYGTNSGSLDQSVEFIALDTDAKVTLETGTWSFKLQALKSDNTVLLEGLITDRAITTNSTLDFTLVPLAIGNGLVEVTVSWNGSTQTVNSVETIWNSGILDPALTVDTLNKEVVFTKSDVPTNNYFLTFKLKDTNGKVTSTVSEIVVVKPNLTSTKTITLIDADFNKPPLAPESLTVNVLPSATENGKVKLDWLDKSNNEEKFVILWNDGTTTGNIDVSASHETYTWESADRSKTYSFTVKAVNEFGENESNTISSIKFVTGISLNKSTTSIASGGSETLTATITPNDANNTGLLWSSSDENKAVVSTGGVITGVSSGEATITVKTVDGEKTSTCTVTVSGEAFPGALSSVVDSDIPDPADAEYFTYTRATYLTNYIKPTGKTSTGAFVYHKEASGEEDWVTKTGTEFGVCLTGGGSESDAAIQWMLNKGKNGDVVVLRMDDPNEGWYDDTATPKVWNYPNETVDTDSLTELFISLGADSVTTLLVKTQAQANDTFVEQAIKNAEVLWICGGNQTDYYNFWNDTKIETAINYLVNTKLVPIGGTSAGMHSMGKLLHTPGKNSIDESNSVISNDVVADPYISTTEGTTLGSGTFDFSDSFLNIPFMDNIITDTHWETRDRMGRSIVMMARAKKDNLRTIDQIRLIAANECSAVCIDSSGIGTVFGEYDETYNDAVYFFKPSTTTPETFICNDNSNVQWAHTGGAIKAYYVRGYTDGRNTFNINTWEPVGTEGTNYFVYNININGRTLNINGTNYTIDSTNGNETYYAIESSGGSGGDTPPTWASGYPKIDTSLTDKFLVKIDEVGVVYWIAVTSGSTAPTPAQVKSGVTYGDVTVHTANNLAMTANTENYEYLTDVPYGIYDVYIVAEDAQTSPNLQTSVSKLTITLEGTNYPLTLNTLHTDCAIGGSDTTNWLEYTAGSDTTVYFWINDKYNFTSTQPNWANYIYFYDNQQTTVMDNSLITRSDTTETGIKQTIAQDGYYYNNTSSRTAPLYFSFSVTAGHTYYIKLFNDGSAGGNAKVKISTSAPTNWE